MAYHDELDDQDSPDNEPDTDDTMPCPQCHKLIYEEAQRCPHCGEYILDDGASGPPHRWWIWLAWALVILALLAFLVNSVLSR